MTQEDSLPSAQEAVRRALAQARHTDPVPAEVVARLEVTLSALLAERQAELQRPHDVDAEPAEVPHAEGESHAVRETPAPVVSIASRRRRGSILLAAAAAVVAFATAPTWWPSSSTQHSFGDAATSAADSSSPDAAATAPESPRASAPGDSRSLNERYASGGAETMSLALPTLDPSGNWVAQADRLLSAQDARGTAAESSPDCRPRQLTSGLAHRAVLFGTTPAVLVERSMAAGSRFLVVDCQGTVLARS